MEGSISSWNGFTGNIFSIFNLMISVIIIGIYYVASKYISKLPI